jgi:hypothetical protein
MFWRFGEKYLYPKRRVNPEVDDLSDTSREYVNNCKHIFLWGNIITVVVSKFATILVLRRRTLEQELVDGRRI